MKLCPTCQVRRGGRVSPTSPAKSESDYMDLTSPDALSPYQSRRQSLTANRSPLSVQSPLPGVAGFSSTFQSQNRWMAPMQKHLQAEGISQSSYYDLTRNSRYLREDLTLPPNSHNTVFSSGTAYSNGDNSIPSSSGYSSSSLQAINGRHTPANMAFVPSSSIKAE